MTGDQLNYSSGDAVNAQPPTPRQTPTSGAFPSPVFETPKVDQTSTFDDSAGWTPRFAEEYSVFNATPGNLRGTDGPFADFAPGLATPGARHKRLHSAEGFLIHANPNQLSTNSQYPPIDPSRRLQSSPGQQSGQQQPLLQQSAKKARRGTVSEPEPPTQAATPPPTSHRAERKLAPKFNMQNDQSFGQPDFGGMTQQQEMAALTAASHDMFDYPLSAPAVAPPNFWDPSGMGMDLDIGTPASHAYQAPTPGHRHTGSFDWNSEIPLFQDPPAPMPSANQENVQPARRERVLAPKPAVPTQGTAAATAAMTAAFSAPLEDPFGMMNAGPAVSPGLLFTHPQASSMGMNFNNPMAQTGTAEAAIAESGSRSSMAPDLRRASSFKETRPERTHSTSPVKISRPGLGRSMSENRGKKPAARPQMLAPAARPVAQNTSGPGASQRAVSRPSGRVSPSKSQQRLAPIPESPAPPCTRTSVKLTVDSRGRARAETRVVVNDPRAEGSVRRRTSRDSSRRDAMDSCDDDSSTDDEPIIIPSRTNSFNASFALPDPRKPVGSIFYSSRRSISDRSTSTLDGARDDAESEAETVLNDKREDGGDAIAALRKVVEDRQKRSSQLGSSRSQRYIQTNLNNFRGNNTASPSALTESSLATDFHSVRCVCNRANVNDGDGFMVQCESCEMWLHGKCINMTRRTMPRVYICAFCANTPNMRGGKICETGRAGASASSPLTNKSFRSFR